MSGAMTTMSAGRRPGVLLEHARIWSCSTSISRMGPWQLWTTIEPSPVRRLFGASRFVVRVAQGRGYPPGREPGGSRPRLRRTFLRRWPCASSSRSMNRAPSRPTMTAADAAFQVQRELRSASRCRSAIRPIGRSGRMAPQYSRQGLRQEDVHPDEARQALKACR